MDNFLYANVQHRIQGSQQSICFAFLFGWRLHQDKKGKLLLS
jgi:hypothetical protein